MKFDSFVKLGEALKRTTLFNDGEIRFILSLCGTASIGAAVNVCQQLQMGLTGDDIDTMFNTCYEDLEEIADELWEQDHFNLDGTRRY